jgi:hypothetical protein
MFFNYRASELPEPINTIKIHYEQIFTLWQKFVNTAGCRPAVFTLKISFSRSVFDLPVKIGLPALLSLTAGLVAIFYIYKIL